jgi:hypothetical protein
MSYAIAIEGLSFSAVIKELADKWYHHDEHQLPNGHLVLGPVSDANCKIYWDDSLPTLRQAWTFIVWGFQLSDYEHFLTRKARFYDCVASLSAFYSVVSDHLAVFIA